jgi:uncharacterized protein
MTPVAPKIAEVLGRYRELTSFCDRFFAKAAAEYGAQMRCRSGCDQCCEIETVCALEAVLLRRAIVDLRKGQTGRPRPKRGKCLLLEAGRCVVYADRPIICRTHGLPLVDKSHDPFRVSTCSLNFTGLPLESLDVDKLFDEQRVSMNLMRLNLALCTLIGRADLAGVRFRMRDIVSARLPEELGALATGAGDLLLP